MDEYREVIKNHMNRDNDRHHIAYFQENEKRIGAVSYCTYKSEDGKCFILDFFIFPQFQCKGKGHEAFDVLKKYAESDGALYYEINCDGRADRLKFGKSLGFVENGEDKYGVPLLIRQ